MQDENISFISEEARKFHEEFSQCETMEDIMRLEERERKINEARGAAVIPHLDKKHRYDESMRRLHALLLTEASKQRRNGNRYWRRGARNNPKVGKWDVVKGTDYPGRWNGLEDFGDICDTCLYGTPGGNGYMAFRKGANSMKFFFAEVRNDNGKPRYTPIKPDAVPAEILCDRERWGYHPGRGFNPYAVV